MTRSFPTHVMASGLAVLLLLNTGCAGGRGDSLANSLGSEADRAEASDAGGVADGGRGEDEGGGNGDAGPSDQAPADVAPEGTDAGSSTDSGAPPGQREPDAFSSALGDAADYATLLALGAAPLGDDERSAPGALEFALQEPGSTPASDRATDPGGRVVYLLLRWGFVVGQQPPANPGWVRYDGAISVSEGEVELLGALRWDGELEPTSPRPERDVAAVSADPRLVRFSSHVGTGVDGVFVRITRPSLAPSVVSLRLQDDLRHYAFESFLGTGSSIGGWTLTAGGAEVQSQLARRTPVCYVVKAEVSGSISYGDPRAGTLASITGNIARPGSTATPFTLTAGTTLFHPYGTLTGSVDGVELRAFYARDWSPVGYERGGALVGQLGDAADGEAPELLLGSYYRGVLSRGRVVQQVDCATEGASDVTPFELI